MKIKRIVFAGLFLVSGLTIVSAQVKLSFNPEKGKKYEYQTEVIQNFKLNGMGQEILIEMEMNTKSLMEIKDKTPQETTVHFTYEGMAYFISTPTMKTGFDSKNPVENLSDMDQILSKIIGVIIGQSLMVVIAPDGSVKSVCGMDAIGESIVGEIHAANNIKAVSLGIQMKQQFNDEAMKKMLEQSFKIYPGNPVKTGDSWNMESMTTAINNMNADLKTKYTLKSVKKKTAIVAVEGEIEMNPGAGMEGKITGTQTGTMTVDTRTGLPLTNDVSQNMKGAIKVHEMVDNQLEMTVKTKTSIKEVK